MSATWLMRNNISSTPIQNIGLVYYGFSKIKDVASRDFFVQTTVIERSPEHKFVDLPDVMICTTGIIPGVPDINLYGTDHPNVSSTTYVVSTGAPLNPSYSNFTSVSVNSTPCFNWHDFLTIFTIDNGLVVWDDVNALMWTLPLPTTNETDIEQFHNLPAVVFVIPRQENPYTRLGESPTSEISYPPSYGYNSYFVGQTDTAMELRYTAKATKVIRKDMWGLFGAYEDELEYSVTSTVYTIANNDPYIQVVVPTMYLNESQILSNS
ncbi:hypothetical protein BGX26_004120 [Mortierella sp. AD094]|nr:hypothetical protein BGX26_004120 [Mortierella sp. AD094]